MTTFKMPKPTEWHVPNGIIEGYTPEQLSQAMRDALEQAATYADKMGMITAPEIRAMIKEIPE